MPSQNKSAKQLLQNRGKLEVHFFDLSVYRGHFLWEMISRNLKNTTCEKKNNSNAQMGHMHCGPQEIIHVKESFPLACMC